jgi:hypothetical protein
MRETSPEDPISILNALGSTEDNALMTVAAFMLLAGARIRASEVELEDLDRLGLYKWWVSRAPENGPQDIVEYRKIIMEHRKATGLESGLPIDPKTYYQLLGTFINEAVNRQGLRATLLAVALGIDSPDDLIRICALTSATELFRISRQELRERLFWFASRDDLNPTARTLSEMLAARMFSSMPASNLTPPTAGAQGLATSGLMLIHGTNFPPARPTWSVPGTGPLFNYIRSIRPDLYGKSDYFRWEGGYSDYAREVAADNLINWVHSRSLRGIDGVTHSHGGNVLMAATKGTSFSKVIFLSCPVHWNKYQPASNSIKKAISIRIKLDLVILGDRANQRFPNGSGISETVLPIWFTSHSDTCEPKIWQKQKLDQFL